MTTKLKITPHKTSALAIEELREMVKGNKIISKCGMDTLAELTSNGASVTEDINSFDEAIFMMDIDEKLESTRLSEFKQMTGETNSLEAIRVEKWNDAKTGLAYINGASCNLSHS